jgi:hypothetical protein
VVVDEERNRGLLKLRQLIGVMAENLMDGKYLPLVRYFETVCLMTAFLNGCMAYKISYRFQEWMLNNANGNVLDRYR